MPTRSTACAISLVLFAATAATAGDVWAQRSRDKARESHRDLVDRAEPQRHGARQLDHRALSDAVRRVERRTGGQVLSAERVPYDGRSINRVKVVDSSGRVRVYIDDPTSRGAQGPRRLHDDDS